MHVYIWVFGHQMNASAIYNMVLELKLGLCFLSSSRRSWCCTCAKIFVPSSVDQFFFVTTLFLSSSRLRFVADWDFTAVVFIDWDCVGAVFVDRLILPSSRRRRLRHPVHRRRPDGSPGSAAGSLSMVSPGSQSRAGESFKAQAQNLRPRPTWTPNPSPLQMSKVVTAKPNLS
jgi:hypothetical protein